MQSHIAFLKPLLTEKDFWKKSMNVNQYHRSRSIGFVHGLLKQEVTKTIQTLSYVKGMNGKWLGQREDKFKWCFRRTGMS